MSVVQLNGEFLIEAFQALFALKVYPDHVLKRARYEEVLLLEPQFTPLRGLIVRVENLRDVFRIDFVVHGAVVVAGIEQAEVEGTFGLGFPQPQQVCGIDAVAQHSGIERSSLDDLVGNPANTIPSALVAVRFGMSAEVHVEANIRARNFPGIAEAQPLIRDFTLPSVSDLLIEDSQEPAASPSIPCSMRRDVQGRRCRGRVLLRAR